MKWFWRLNYCSFMELNIINIYYGGGFKYNIQIIVGWHQPKSTTNKSDNTSRSTWSIGISTTPLKNLRNSSPPKPSTRNTRLEMSPKPNYNPSSRNPPPKPKINYNFKRKTKPKTKSIKRYYKQADRSSLCPSIYCKSSTTSRKVDPNIKPWTRR